MNLRQRNNDPVHLDDLVELSTRLKAKHALETNRALRGKVFQRVKAMFVISKIPDPNVASTVMDLYWKHNVLPFLDEVRYEWREWPEFLVYNELRGFMQNIHTNALLRINPHAVKLKRQYDVARKPLPVKEEK